MKSLFFASALVLASVSAFASADECADKSLAVGTAMVKVNAGVDAALSVVTVDGGSMGVGGATNYKVEMNGPNLYQSYEVVTAQSEGPCQVISVTTTSLAAVSPTATSECVEKSVYVASAMAEANGLNTSTSQLTTDNGTMGEGGALNYKVEFLDAPNYQAYTAVTAQSEEPCQVVSVTQTKVGTLLP